MFQASKNIPILLAICGLLSCCSPKTYLIKKQGNEIILNGNVPKSVLDYKKKYPWFYYGYLAYQPNEVLVKKLKPIAKDLRVLVVGGSWCSDTQLELPKFYKLSTQMGIEPGQIELIMVDRKKTSFNLNVQNLQVKNVPAFLFYKDGKEQGRIIEKPDSCFEMHLIKIFNLWLN